MHRTASGHGPEGIREDHRGGSVAMTEPTPSVSMQMPRGRRRWWCASPWARCTSRPPSASRPPTAASRPQTLRASRCCQALIPAPAKLDTGEDAVSKTRSQGWNGGLGHARARPLLPASTPALAKPMQQLSGKQDPKEASMIGRQDDRSCVLALSLVTPAVAPQKYILRLVVSNCRRCTDSHHEERSRSMQ